MNNNNNRPRLGNIINRVFESAGPDGKVRGTPQQIIEKYQALARDAQLSGDRVAAESFLQHSEHYNRMLNEATQAQNEQRQVYEREDAPRDEFRRDETGAEAPREPAREQGHASAPREQQPREHQPRDQQPREHQPREQQSRNIASRDREDGRDHAGQRNEPAPGSAPGPLPVIASSFEAIDPRDEDDSDLVYTPERAVAAEPPMPISMGPEPDAPKANGHAEPAMPAMPAEEAPPAPEAPATEEAAAAPKPPAKRGRPRRKAAPDPEAAPPPETT